MFSAMGFTAGPAIAAVAAESAHVRLGHEVVQVHLRDAVDRVDERNGVGAAALWPRAPA